MPQLKHGARRSLNYLYADMRDILAHAHNPGAVQRLAERCIERLEEEIEPRLQREAPALEQRLNELEERVGRLEAQKVVVIQRKEA
jgi:polyhydroxyalkanoate synthesis regulator phasin